MEYYAFNVSGKEYKLRLTTRNVVELEKELGKNPLFLFKNKENNNAPTVEEMVKVLWCSLKAHHEGKTLDDAFVIFDEWIAEGHIFGEFTSVIVEVFIISGIFKNPKEKN